MRGFGSSLLPGVLGSASHARTETQKQFQLWGATPMHDLKIES